MATSSPDTSMVMKPWFKNHLPLKQWQYLKIKVWSENGLDVKMTEVAFRMSLQQAIQSTLGWAGTGSKIDVLDWNEETHIGIVKVPQSELVMIWGAIAVHQFAMAEQACALDILDTSASLISLADNSRDI
ncbi:uncharacterized protein BX664DRAFT_326978 [Halteromyces radiatus]|uniref:uncharacterized protein n=1 Tax=Halteromyces radiatus TaxID=101107 RepID=UPI00221EA105|nr:uncharacterized protein BX664DRAFT_326978 [Halteromyces radiatus]KAI8097676.1 hypothetical protein BX664DRAFT_326978 [Halteromyces radiatus]